MRCAVIKISSSAMEALSSKAWIPALGAPQRAATAFGAPQHDLGFSLWNHHWNLTFPHARLTILNDRRLGFCFAFGYDGSLAHFFP